jgi:hypothetical protein
VIANTSVRLWSALLVVIALSACGELLDLEWTPADGQGGGDAGEDAGVESTSMQESVSTGAGGSAGSASASSAASATVCSEPSDCAVAGTACLLPACVAGVCSFVNAPVAAKCEGGAVCDGRGACVECVADAQCDQGHCEHNHCYGCGDGVLNGSETDTDCGGPECEKCHVGQHCLTNSDCHKSSCADGTCKD